MYMLLLRRKLRQWEGQVGRCFRYNFASAELGKMLPATQKVVYAGSTANPVYALAIFKGVVSLY